MSLLDYYRQFEGMSEEEVNARLREDAAERKRKALTRVETLDLSQTTWPELPHPYIVNAITFVARRGLHRYPHLHGSDLRRELAERHGVEPDRLIIGLTIKQGILAKDKYVPSEHVARILEGEVHLALTRDRIEVLAEFKEPAPEEQVLPESSTWYQRLAWWLTGRNR